MPAPGLPDWRDSAEYADLARLDCAGWAWEWLRRTATYREAASGRQAGNGVDPSAARFGLLRFEDPALAAGDAQPFWTSLASAFVLDASGAPANLVRSVESSTIATLLGGTRGKIHLLITNRRSALRLDFAAARSRHPRSGLLVRVPAPDRLAAQIVALAQLETLWRTGGLRDRPLSAPQAARLVRLLRVADGLASGASQRGLAGHLLDSDVAAPRWRLERPTVRSQVQRLVRQCRAMLGGGFWSLLTAADHQRDLRGSKIGGSKIEPPSSAPSSPNPGLHPIEAEP